MGCGLTRVEGLYLQPRSILGRKLGLLRCPAQTDQAAKALAGRHGTSGGTDAEALRPFCIALAPVSYELRPAWGAFFVPNAAVLTGRSRRDVLRQQWIACSRHSPARQLKRLTLAFNAAAIFR